MVGLVLNWKQNKITAYETLFLRYKNLEIGTISSRAVFRGVHKF